MKIALVHNYYQQPGGEDVVFASEKALLARYGQEVITFTEHNHHVRDMNLVSLAVNTIWSTETNRKLRAFLDRTGPDIVHFHNTFVRLSPSAYYACSETGIPVVQSLHNPRLLCPSANFYRRGRICEDCLAKTPPWPAVAHACYRRSRSQSMVVAMMLTFHRWLKTWSERVRIYIAFTNFYRRKFIEGGLPRDKIFVKPHFVDPDPGPKERGAGDYALFIGRLDPEKGVRTLLRAWQQLKTIPLKIRGDGHLMAEVEDSVREGHLTSVEIVPRLSKEALYTLIKGASFLVWPSEGLYETFGLVAIEAFACGVPVIASNLGVASEIVKNERTGLLFAPGEPDDLAAKANRAWTHPDEMGAMGREARREFESKYTAERNYEMLIEIYQRALAQAGDHDLDPL